MQNNVEPDFQSQLDAVFAQLPPRAVEAFYTSYQAWSLHQRVYELRQRIEMVRAQQAENEQRLREAQPSAIAFAALARLQSNGVSDIALLDAMLERGESWLDQTMQRLDYFEQFDDFISDDYTKWCQGALEGAFDWIDSLREDVEPAHPAQFETPPEQLPANGEDAIEVEALLLQRLATEHEEDLSWQEATTLKRPAIQPQEPEIVSDTPVEQELPLPAEEQILPEEASPVEESALSAAEPEQPALIEFAPLEETTPDEEEPHTGEGEPPLIETAPVDELLTEGDEIYTGDEEPTFVEFAALSPAEVSAPEEPAVQETEQAAPADVPAQEEAGQNGVNEPREVEMSAPEEATSYEQQAVSSSEPILPANGTSRKRGVIGTLVWILTGK